VEFNKFLGTVTPFIMSPGFATTERDDDILQLLSILIDKIQAGSTAFWSTTTDTRRSHATTLGGNSATSFPRG
jgi:hypothetical protein